MRLPKRPGKMLASALLAAAVLGAAPDASRARTGADGQAPARFLERPSETMAAAQVRRARQARQHRRLQRLRVEQAAHAQMPDTMYASTPDPTTPPHPFPLDASMRSTPERVATPARASARSGAGRGHRITLFPAAARWEEKGYQGFARLINRSGEAGEVRIDAYDDEGTHRGPLTLRIGANRTVHFNSEDLEGGNAGKGLDGATGAGAGDWRLELTSGLDIEVLAYIRTRDGFLTAMHDGVPRSEAGHQVVTFNPGKNAAQVSRLRLVNPGETAAEVRIEGIDGQGRSPGEAVVVEVPVGAARTLSARELESGGTGFTGALGTGTGKWRLVVSSAQAIEVMSLLASPTGHLTNLSTVAARTESAAQVFREHISGPIVQGKCIACHVAGGVSGSTRLVFVPSSESDHEARNLQAFKTFIDEVEDVAADLWLGGFDTHADHDPDHEWLLGNLTDSVDYLWDYAEEHGVADRMVVVIGSDFGRTNFYNAQSGKDHWPIGSFVVMEKNQPWTGRAVGETDGLHFAQRIHPRTLRRDDRGGTIIYPKHMHKALRRYLGIANTPGAQRFPFNNTEDFAFFG